MNAKLAFLKLAFLLLAFLLSGEPHQTAAAYQQAANTQREGLPTLQNGGAPTAHTDRAHNDPPKWYTSPEWWLVGIAVLTLIAIYYQARETAHSARATTDTVEAIKRQIGVMEQQTVSMEAAADAAKKSAEAASVNNIYLINRERAHLELGRPPSTPGGTPTINPDGTWNQLVGTRVWFKNRGLSEARITRSSCSLKQTTDNTWLSLTEYEIGVNDKLKHTVVNGGGTSDDCPRSLNVIGKEPATPLFVHFYGIVEYMDVFEQRRETSFYWRIEIVPWKGHDWIKGPEQYNQET